jgi:hypothetical protein
VQKPQNSLKSSEFPKLRRDNIFIYAQGGLKSKSSQRRKKAKVEAFSLGILPSLGRTCGEAQEEQQLPLDLPKGSGPLKFHVQGAAGGAHRRRDLDRRILIQNTRQPSDLTGVARELKPS